MFIDVFKLSSIQGTLMSLVLFAFTLFSLGFKNYLLEKATFIIAIRAIILLLVVSSISYCLFSGKEIIEIIRKKLT